MGVLSAISSEDGQSHDGSCEEPSKDGVLTEASRNGSGL